MAVPASLRRGLRLPVIASPMFIVSSAELVIAQCTSGIIGSTPSLNARPDDQLAVWLDRITDALAAHDAAHPDRPSAPFAINLIVHKSNERLAHDLEVCAHYKVPLVITSLGANTEVFDAVHGWGGLVFHDVINQGFAHKAIDKGADGLILVAVGAGGHAGTQSPLALVSETRAWFDGPIALSGSISTGGGVLAAQAMGADFGYVGSAFIATEEANAVPAYKQAIVDAVAEDILYSSYFTGVKGNYLRASVLAAGLDPANLPEGDLSKMDFKGGSGKKAWRDIWGAGQGVGSVKQVVPAAALVDRLAREYEEAKARISSAS